MNELNYLKVVTLFFIVVFAAVGGFVFYANPYDLYEIEPTKYTRSKYKVASFERVIKPVAVSRQRPKTVILGTSRASVGLDPKTLAVLTRERAYNFAITGSYIDEISAALRHAVRQAGSNAVVWGIDYFSFTRLRPDGVRKIAFIDDCSIFCVARTFAEMTVSLKALRDAVETVVRNALGHSADHTVLGHYIGYDSKGVLPDKPAVHLQPPFETAYDIFDKMLGFGLSRGVKFHLFISPTYRSHFRHGEKYRRWADRVVKIAQKHNISIMRSDLDPFFTADKRLYFDSGHFKTEVVNRFLRNLLLKKLIR